MVSLDPVLESITGCLQREVAADARAFRGLEAAFVSSFPVVGERALLLYRGYAFDEPRESAEECRRIGATYERLLKVKVQLVVGTRAPKTYSDPAEHDLAAAVIRDPHDIASRHVYADWLEQKSRVADAKQARAGETVMSELAIADVKEQELGFGTIAEPWYDGSFIIDGTPRTLVPRTMTVRLPGEDRERARVVMPGDWIALAVARGLEKLRPKLLAALASDEIETLFPHDFVNAIPVARELATMFTKSVGSRAAKGSSLAARFEQLCSIQPESTRAKPAHSVLEELVPFGDAKTRVAGAKALRTARLLRSPSPPRLATGEEAELVAAGIVRRAPVAGRIECIDDSTAVIWPDDEAAFDAGLASTLVIDHSRNLTSQLPDLASLCVRDGEHVDAGAPILIDPRIVNGMLALGREATVAFDPETRSATVSDRFAASMSAHDTIELEAALEDTTEGPHRFAADVDERADLDEVGIVRVGAVVQPGNAVVGIRTATGVDISLRLPAGPAWTVAAVWTLWRKGSEDNAHDRAAAAQTKARAEVLAAAAKRHGGALGQELEQFALQRKSLRGTNLPRYVHRSVRVVLVRDIPLVVGDTLVDRRGFAVPVSVIVPASRIAADLVLPSTLPAGTREEAAAGSLYLLRP